MPFEANYVAVLVAGVASVIAGWLWYGAIFRKTWVSLSGKSEEELKSASPGGAMFWGFIAALVTAYMLAYVLSAFGAASVAVGLSIAFWVWLGFYATTMLGMVLWDGKPFKLYILNISYQLVNILIMAAILVSWV